MRFQRSQILEGIKEALKTSMNTLYTSADKEHGCVSKGA